MTDAEVICGFMEPRPVSFIGCVASDAGWWRCKESCWLPRSLDLAVLRNVEERLTEEQIGEYDAALRKMIRDDPNDPWVPAKCFAWHMSAEQKITALAAVIRAGKSEVKP